ncbi:MAG: metallophosphoesterase family protein [Polyangiaceae bacterium]|nr:metallophosphoesterase family protein [Polyangiaceae bacterium]
MVRRATEAGRRATRHASAELAFAGDVLRLVVVADTHSAPHPAAGELIRRERPDRILHAGDIGRLEVLDELAAIAPVLAVRGNVDACASGAPPDSLVVSLRHEGEVVLRLLLVHIAVYGPKLRADAAALARTHGAGLVLCGHSHVPFIGRDKGLVVFNPGSIGPRRFSLPVTFGVLEIARTRLVPRHVDCATGATWEP